MTHSNRIARWASLMAGAHCLTLMGQPVLAGWLLSGGGSNALNAHLWNGRLAVGLCAVTFVLFTIAWRRGIDNGGKSIVTLSLLVAEILQFVLGYARETAWHIPLGATIFAAAAVLAFTSIRQHIMPGTISGS